MRCARAFSLLTLVTLALGGCALKDPYPRGGSNSPLPPRIPLPAAFNPTSPTSTPSSTATTSGPSFVADADPGAAGTARYVAFRFARAYGNDSPARAVQRDQTLSSLATPALAHTFLRPTRSPKYETTRGLPYGTSMVAHVISIRMDPPQADFDHGQVVLQSAMEQASGTGEQPFATIYEVDLLRTASVWRVAAFTDAP